MIGAEDLEGLGKAVSSWNVTMPVETTAFSGPFFPKVFCKEIDGQLHPPAWLVFAAIPWRAFLGRAVPVQAATMVAGTEGGR